MELNLCLKCIGALGFPCQEFPCLSVPPLQGCFFPSWTMWRQCWKNSNASCLFLLTKALLLIQSISKNDSVDKIGCQRRFSLFLKISYCLGCLTPFSRGFGNVLRQGPSCWKSNNPDRTQTAAESGLTLISRQVKRWFCVIKDNISTNSFML